MLFKQMFAFVLAMFSVLQIDQGVIAAPLEARQGCVKSHYPCSRLLCEDSQETNYSYDSREANHTYQAREANYSYDSREANHTYQAREANHTYQARQANHS
ncbi:uncharacterized protein MELLADRAFT_65154 [Melampsora larici-populina 98AG31]|uniref:Secreted protein n=1 Tax=Melampsora larici-populina (strain 98AG31 / pathotype 3-4-7) TaxID=747676 RepID=F4RU60_MELLP|nr:uncharacterized protein MELLADRAFT_65154 [Melampsora larici-populina 98AG31]EGG04121.1 hypothetical protein MELLADRAFT_65154 [Melampsora larici-populina 98AG31]